MAFDVFISYSSKDKTTADAACAALEAAGIRCWIAPRDVRPGTEYGAAIIDAIESCRVMVLIFSSNSNASVQIHREIERAASKNVPILPMRIEQIIPTRAMEYFLGQIHWLDALTPPLAKHLQDLVESVKANLQVDPAGRMPPIGDNSRPGSVFDAAAGAGGLHADRKVSGSLAFLQSRKWSIAGALAALACLGVAIVMWQSLAKPSPPATAAQQILLNVLRAANGDNLAFSANVPSNFNATLQKTIDLGDLKIAIRNGYPTELLFWLLSESFALSPNALSPAAPSSNGGVFGYAYNPPDDYGCSEADPQHRCYVDWIRLLAFAGVTIEQQTRVIAGTSPTPTVFSRFCFDPLLAERTMTLSPDQAKIAIGNLDGSPSNVTARCGSAWNPLIGVDMPLPDTFNFFIGPSLFKIVPRSPASIFGFLGRLAKMMQGHIAPSSSAYIPPGRDDVTKPPVLVTVHDDPNLLTIVKNSAASCYVEVRYIGGDYCVPAQATTTKNIINFLIFVTGLPATSGG
jgi:hypothetical protein